MLNRDSKKIAYEITEPETLHDGRYILFILPGGPGLDSSIYKPFYSQLQTVAHLIFLDPRGCGMSDKYELASCYTMDGYTDDIRMLCHHLSLNKVSLLGVSYGSMVALNFAVKYKEEIIIEKLFLIGGAPSYRFIEQAKKNLLARGIQPQIDVCNKWLWDGSFESAEDLIEYNIIMRPLYSLSAAKSNTPLSYQTKWVVEPVNEAWRTQFWRFDLVNQLHQIKAEKTYIIFGKYDWINDPSFAIEMNKYIHSSQLFLLESGHSIASDQPEVLKQILFSSLINGGK
jgi:proline iminopeptidase